MSLLARALAVSAVFYATYTMPAHAYLDPGTGSMILQVLLGGAAGVALAGRYYWDKVRTFFGFEPAIAEANDPDRQLRSKPKVDQ